MLPTELGGKLTETEIIACRLLGEAWNAMLSCGTADAEAAAHIHALQHAVMAQAARRMHPDIFRPPISETERSSVPAIPTLPARLTEGEVA